MYKLSPKNYSYVWIFGILFLLLPSGVANAGTLVCSVEVSQAACTALTGTVILRMSGNGNAHAELPSQSNANYNGSIVCCRGVTGLGNSCSGTTATVLRLAGVTNAHSEENSQANAAYTSNACISVASGSVSVGYAAGVTCASLGYDTTLASMSGITNAHIGNSAAYAGIQICATAAGTPPPTLTTYTNSTETALNYAAACTGCGARIGTGGAKQTVVITGTNFGTDPGVGNYSTATNNVKVGAQQIASSNVTAWSATSITFLTDTNVAGDADSDWGADFGGASALKVTAGGAASAGLNFYMFPQVTGVRACNSAGFSVGNNGREYNGGDAACPNGLTDGEVFLDGTRFGTSATGGSVTLVGITATTGSWSNTLIKAQVSPSIADSTYTGNLIVQQGAGSNFKTHTFTTTGFRVLPRITSLSPTSGSSGDTVTVNGNHFCESGTCPSGSFSAADKVAFTSADATFFGSWTHTAIGTKVPTGATTGNVVVTSNTTYTSNGNSFTIISSTPSDSTSLNQYKNSGLTQAIATGGVASSTPIYITMTMQAGLSGGTLYPQVEYQPIGTGFACTGTSACGTATEGTGVAGPGPIDCSDTAKACAIAISPIGTEVYHWQARVRHNKSGTDYYSAWVSFGPVGEGTTDFKIDTLAPTIAGISSGTPGSNTATLTWNTTGPPSETSTSRIEYNTTNTFTGTYDCAGTSDCTALIDTSPTVLSHSITLSNLNSGTTYYYKVRSKDAAGNESVSGVQTFATASITQPAKTVSFNIGSTGDEITGGSATTTVFSIEMPENATAMKSAYVQIEGVYVSGASSNNVTVQFNAEASKTYTIPVSSTNYFKILHPVTAVSVSPATNTLTITAQANVSLYTLSALITVTYGYTP